jgi:hydroxyacylglutathione hydrolase
LKKQLKVNNMKTIVMLNIVLYYSLLVLTGQGLQQSSPWFAVKEIKPGVWVIDDQKAVKIYLVEGTDSALLIDTGMGAADLLSQVRKLTAKPINVVNTHGHSDHAGADYQFARIYIHPADSASARSSIRPESRTIAARNMLRGSVPQQSDIYAAKELHPVMTAVRNGYTFNLGGRHIQVIETPGHTPGSICLLDKEDRLLFSGDNDNTAVWLFLPECLPLSVYFKSLQDLYSRISEFDTLLPGHGLPKKSSFIADQIECVKSILNHSCPSEPYDTFAGKARICKYGDASVAYNPDNL